MQTACTTEMYAYIEVHVYKDNRSVYRGARVYKKNSDK